MCRNVESQPDSPAAVQGEFGGQAVVGVRPSASPTGAAAIDEAITLYRAVARQLRALSLVTFFEHDLTMAQLRGIAVIGRGPTTIGEFATTLGIAQPTASLLVERLVRNGFVERADDPADRRRARIELTPEGERVIAQVRGDVRERLAAALGRLTSDDLRALVQGLRALSEAVTTEEASSLGERSSCFQTEVDREIKE